MVLYLPIHVQVAFRYLDFHGSRAVLAVQVLGGVLHQFLAPHVFPMVVVPDDIFHGGYTTNFIENFNRQLRKVTKSKTIFPTDDALFKMLYLAMMDATKKWTGKAWDWGLTLDQLCIYFGDRIQPEDID